MQRITSRPKPRQRAWTIQVENQNKEKTSMANTNPWPASGNVGIGTASPIGTLDVRGFNMLTDANGEFNSHFPWTDNSAYVTGQTIHLRGGAPQGWKTALTVDGASGNVGIGTASPREKLQVISNSIVPGEGILAAANLDRVGDAVAISGAIGSSGVPVLPGRGPVAVLGWVDPEAENGIGVRGFSNTRESGIGVLGESAMGTGVRGESSGIAVHGINVRHSGFAGRFDGNVVISAGAGIKFQADGTGLGFFGAATVAQPTVTGSRGGNAALTSLLTALSTLGLLVDSTTP
jgi:hypothetical protein